MVATDKKKNVVCVLPRTGLGNQLFPLMKTFVFAYLNGLETIVVGYNRIRIGPYLRGEKSKRNYANYFSFQKSLIGELLDQRTVKKLVRQEVVDEPLLQAVERAERGVYRFSALPHWDDYFFQLKNHRDLVIQLFWKVIDKKIIERLNGLKTPVIGVHIRMGDFKKLQQDQDFSKVGATRSPEKYFVEVINSIRQVHGSELPVSVFTDGYKHEFETLFTLNNITLIEGNADIIDMLLLSKSKVIVASAGSTFSYWAGFLSDAPLIMHPGHIHKPLRGHHTENLYEGPFDPANALLVKQIKKISYND